MSLFGSYLGVQAKALHDGVVKTLVNWDPEGASEAQITEYGNKVSEIEGIAAKAEIQAQADEKKADDLQKALDNHIAAADLLSRQMDEASDPAVKSRKETALNKLVAEAEDVKGQLDAAKSAAADSRGYADDMKAAHRNAVTKWTTAKERLAHARREQDRARREAERAKERKHDAEVANGLASGLDTGDIAIQAMEANAAHYRQQAAGANMTAGALKSASEGDDEAAAALAAVSGGGARTGSSIADRLKALRGE